MLTQEDNKAKLKTANLNGLVCPECRGVLTNENSELVCVRCSKKYPVRDGIPCFVELDPNALPFKEEYFEFWFERENTHFWHVGRKEAIYVFTEPYLKSHFTSYNEITGIEIGLGNGNVTTEFVKHGVPMEGADLFYSSLQFCRKRLNIPLYQSDLLKLPFKDKYDFAGIYDIIEHIEDDRLALKNLYNSLKPGGIVSITVPACKFLWSQFDELDHKRRYNKKELVDKVKEAGFKVKRVSFLMFLLLPVVFIVRKTQTYPKDTKLEHVKEVRVVPVINEIFLAIFRLEKILVKFFNLPIGSSLILIAEKPKS
jgi:SAM-dependent methyltransferase